MPNSKWQIYANLQSMYKHMSMNDMYAKLSDWKQTNTNWLQSGMQNTAEQNFVSVSDPVLNAYALSSSTKQSPHKPTINQLKQNRVYKHCLLSCMARFQVRSKDQEILEEGGGIGSSS